MQLRLKFSGELDNAENFFILINAINNKRLIKDRLLFIPLTATQTLAQSQRGCLLPRRFSVKTPELQKDNVPNKTLALG